MSLKLILRELSSIKKCHLCGAVEDTREKILREINEGCYCIFCLGDDGQPRIPNQVRESIKNFWRLRDSQYNESKQLQS